MVRHPKQKKRGIVSHKERMIMIIGVEGRSNKTERLYISALARFQKKYTIHFSDGGDTDPEGMVKNLIRFRNNNFTATEDGDTTYCLIDTDSSIEKQPQIDRAIKMADANQINMIISNPCFEIWFLLHFKHIGTTHIYTSNAEIIDELKKYIPRYQKNVDVFPLLQDKTQNAIDQAKALDAYHAKIGHTRRGLDQNPSTDVYRIVELLRK